MSVEVTIEGLDEIIAKMSAYPVELTKVCAVGMTASLNVLWQNVPPYPPQPSGSSYTRTGTLGRSLGSGESGGASGKPSVFSIRSMGVGAFEGTFGTILEYAPFVIGDTTQAEAFAGRWWKMEDIANKSSDAINTIWDGVGQKLADFLNEA